VVVTHSPPSVPQVTLCALTSRGVLTPRRPPPG
jgi:hypothetical protein